MINILVTGAEGQLGCELNRLSRHCNYNFFFTDIEELNILEKGHILRYMSDNRIDVVVNCAAYTAVNRAEEDSEKADLINHVGAGNLAQACGELDATLVHISTDYVYDGRKNSPYTEADEPNPINIYGKTKYAGELAVWESRCKSIIIRTAWLYSTYGSNFVKTVLHIGNSKEVDDLKVVFDQIGTPTNAYDLAKAILQIIPQILAEPRHGEVYHFTDEGVASWYDLACAVIEYSGMDSYVRPVETGEYKTAAERPVYSVLNKAKIKQEFGLFIPNWRESLKRCISRMELEKTV